VWDASIGTLAVDSVEPAGAAGRSGLVLEDDIVCEVDGITVTGQPLDIVDSLVRGKEGSVLRLVLMRADSQHQHQTREIAITLVREPGASVDIIRPSRTGVGITFETDPIDNSARVKRLIRGSPADCSGLIKTGDIIFEVDNTNVFRESLDVVSQLLLGEPGSDVRLLFLRGTRIFIEATVTRQKNSRQSEMDDVLRYAQSFTALVSKTLTCTDDDLDMDQKRLKIRMPASFRSQA